MIRGINGTTLAVGGVGLVFVYSSIKGKSIAGTFHSFLQGQNPSTAPDANQIDVTTAGQSFTQEQTGAQAAASTGGSATGNQAIGQLMAAGYGWTGSEWTALVNLWNKESGWNNLANNPSSGAYGIAQALPASKYPPAGQQSGGSDPTTQISWGLAYIKSRYGSPSAAWAHEVANNWY